MPEENTETVTQRLQDSQLAFNERDFERAFATLAADVEWHSGPWVLDAGVLNGRAAVIAYYSNLADAGDWQVEPQSVYDAGAGRFVVHQLGRFAGRTTQIDGTYEFFQVYELDEAGLVTRVREFETREQALAALDPAE